MSHSNRALAEFIGTFWLVLGGCGAADGTCYGQVVGPIWGTSVYVKDGDTWKWAFGINTPARNNGV